MDVKHIAHHYVAPSLRTHGPISPFPYMPSWCPGTTLPSTPLYLSLVMLSCDKKNNLQDVRMIGIEKKYISKPFITQTYGLHHYKGKLSKCFVTATYISSLQRGHSF